MTDEQIRIAIAEALGYTHVRIIKDIEGPPDAGIGHHPTKPHSVPDYLNDLNAMHEAEKTLTDDELWEYSKLLMDYRQAANGFPLAWRSEVLKLQKATTRQRCIAFLKTKGILP